MAKIQLFSDIHDRWTHIHPNPQADLFLIAGDASEKREIVNFFNNFNKPVFFVCGNHEYYLQDYNIELLELQKLTKNNKNIHFLNNQTAIFEDIRIIGSTLWNDFKNLDENLLQQALKYINDFHLISTKTFLDQNKDRAKALFDQLSTKTKNDFKNVKNHPVATYLLFQDSLNFLIQELSKPFSGKTIILTHYPPTQHSLHHSGYFPAIINNVHNAKNLINNLNFLYKPYKIAAYSNYLDFLFTNFKIDFWFHGHLHQSLNLYFQKSIIFTNPLGHAKQSTNFKNEYLIDTEAQIKHREDAILFTLQNTYGLNQRYLSYFQTLFLKPDLIIPSMDHEFLKTIFSSYNLLFQNAQSIPISKAAYLLESLQTSFISKTNFDKQVNIQNLLSYMISIAQKNQEKIQLLLAELKF